MASQGLKAFSEGCNAQIQPPQTPGPIFNWSDSTSNTSVLMLLHPRGYGLSDLDDDGSDDDDDDHHDDDHVSSGSDGPIVGAPLVGVGDPCPTVHDVVTVPGFNEALVYAFKDDNQGPPAALEVALVLECINHGQNGTGPLFPGACG